MGYAKNLRYILVTLLLIWPHPAHAQQVDEFGRQIVDVANRYTAVISAARLCAQYTFKDKSQEADFNSNRELSRLYASRIFIKAFPGKPLTALTGLAEKMDRDMEAKIATLHADKGCSGELFQVFLNWFQQMKEFPKAPYPKPDVSDADFQTMASRWLKLNDQLR